MSYKYKATILFFVFYVFTLFNSCKKCDSTDCKNGMCAESTCLCDTSYTGAFCGTEVRAKYLGTFTGNEPCSVTGTATYDITVTPNDSDVTKVYFQNLWDAHETTYGQLKSDGNLYIWEQEISTYRKITGKAIIINGKLKVSYSITGLSSSNSPDNCIWQQL